MSARTRLESFLGVFWGNDGNPADPHVECMKAILRIDLIEEFFYPRQVPLRDFQIRAHPNEQALQVLRETSTGDVGEGPGFDPGLFEVVDDIVVKSGRFQPSGKLLVGNASRFHLSKSSPDQRPAVGVDAVGLVANQNVSDGDGRRIDKIWLFRATNAEAR